MRTSAGISGFGINNCEFTTANNSATAKPDSHHAPFIIFMTGTAMAAHNNARTACNRKSNGSVRNRLAMCAMMLSGSVPP